MKKVLAWAVALALVLSSFTMAFAADTKTSKDFKDASSINYTEAVDVMVATGVINGYPDGTFGPQKTVKRSEMAKMISVMLEAGEDIGDQYKSACPFADSKDHWAAGYIAYCSAEHIIDGRSADVFDPEAEVTGTEVAKMALTSLGYDSKIQGYTGENWAAAVLKDAKKNNLFKGLDKSFVPGDPCSREAAAQILFNTLQANMVEYENGTSVSVGDDVNVVVSSKIQDQTWPKGDKKDDNGDGVKQLYEEVFGGDLAKKEGTTDNEGNPAHTWTYPDKKTEIGTYPDSADYEFVVADASSVDAAIEDYDEDLADEIADYVKDGYVKNYVINDGDKSTTAPAIALGDTVKVFITDPTDDADGEVLVVIMHYVPVQITDVDTAVSDDDAEDGITAYLSFKGELTAADSDMEGYDAATYVEDAVIAVALNGDEVIASYVLEQAASGEVTRVYNSNPPAFTIDGTKYEATQSYVAFDGDVVAEEDAVYALYDYNGYVIASTLEEEAPADDLYGVIVGWGYERPKYSSDKGTYSIKMFTAEGTMAELTLSSDFVTKNELPQNAGFIYDYIIAEGEPEGTLVTYTLNEDGEIDDMVPAGAGFSATKMRSGNVLNGYVVAEDIAVFDIYDADAEMKDTDDWAVYGLSELEAADEISAAATIKPEDSNEYVALLLAKPLEDTTKEYKFGFIADTDSYTSSGETFTTISLWEDGKKATYTTVADYTVGTFDADELVVLTLDSEGAVESVAAPAATRTSDVKDELDDGTVAIYKTPAPDTCDVATAIDDYTIVSGNGAVKFGNTKVDTPNVSSAKVYLYKDGELKTSSVSQIKASNNAAAKIYQIDGDAGVWNIVVFQNNYVEPTVTFEKGTSFFDMVTVDVPDVTVDQKGMKVIVTGTAAEATAEQAPGFNVAGKFIAVKMTVGEKYDADKSTITLSGNGTYKVSAVLDAENSDEITYVIQVDAGGNAATAGFDWDGDDTVDEEYVIDISALLEM